MIGFRETRTYIYLIIINTYKKHIIMTNTSTQPTMKKTVINSADYYINYYGTALDIKWTDKVYCLFVSGSGFTDHAGGYHGGATYELYRNERSTLGKTCVKIGTAEETTHGSEGSLCVIKIDGRDKTTLPFRVDTVFMKIFKKGE